MVRLWDESQGARGYDPSRVVPYDERYGDDIGMSTDAWCMQMARASGRVEIAWELARRLARNIIAGEY